METFFLPWIYSACEAHIQNASLFVNYNQSRGKKFVVKGVHEPKRAVKCILKGCEASKNGNSQ